MVRTLLMNGIQKRLIPRCLHSADIEVTVSFLIEIDKLVQLLESPIFMCMFDFIGNNFPS